MDVPLFKVLLGKIGGGTAADDVIGFHKTTPFRSIKNRFLRGAGNGARGKII
jgi:hypothetical protein